MTDVYKQLATTRTFFTSAGTTVYTVPALTTALVKKVIVSNNTALSGTVKLHHVPSAGSASALNVILPTTALAANEHGVDDAPFAMAAGDFIVAVGDNTAGHDINISIYGLEVS